MVYKTVSQCIYSTLKKEEFLFSISYAVYKGTVCSKQKILLYLMQTLKLHLKLQFLTRNKSLIQIRKTFFSRALASLAHSFDILSLIDRFLTTTINSNNNRFQGLRQKTALTICCVYLHVDALLISFDKIQPVGPGDSGRTILGLESATQRFHFYNYKIKTFVI